MISLHVVDLEAVRQAWEKRTLDAHVTAQPRGRVACLLSGPVAGVVVDGHRPPILALHGLPAEPRRELYHALIEDLARASLHDVAEDALNAALAVIARVSGRHELALDRLRKHATAHADGLGGTVWSIDPSVLAAARNVACDPSLRDADLPEARVAGVERSHIQDVLDSLAVLLHALGESSVSLIAVGSP